MADWGLDRTSCACGLVKDWVNDLRPANQVHTLTFCDLDTTCPG